MNSWEEFEFIPGPLTAPVEGAAPGPDYMIVRLEESGQVALEGPRECVNDFLIECAISGFVIQMDRLSWCG